MNWQEINNCLDQFAAERRKDISKQARDDKVREFGKTFIRDTLKYKYSYNFTWLGFPIIQFPQDIIAMQEIIWTTKPDLIIETGIAHGGSTIFYASLLEGTGLNLPMIFLFW